jgi:hypothetical protein
MTILVIIIVGRGCIFRPATDFPGSHFNRGKNAAWLGVEWINEPHEEDEIIALADDLERRQIRYVLVYVSYLRADGEFGAPYDHAAEFVRVLKEAQPDLQILAWIGLPLQQSRGPGWGYVDLGDEATCQKVVTFSAHLVHQIGFDGVHLGPEPIPDGDDNVLALLEEVRRAIGPEATLSMATRRIWPLFPDAPWPFVGQIAWRGDYYREIVKRVNQVAVMTYDSGLPLPCLYRHWTRFQTIEVSRAVEGTEVELLLGIPTSEEETLTHRPGAENMTSGLQGVIDGLNDLASRPSAVTGVAIYPYWETGETEWTVYESLWLGMEQTP